jgi:hypothetical protein
MWLLSLALLKQAIVVVVAQHHQRVTLQQGCEPFNSLLFSAGTSEFGKCQVRLYLLPRSKTSLEKDVDSFALDCFA